MNNTNNNGNSPSETTYQKFDRLIWGFMVKVFPILVIIFIAYRYLANMFFPDGDAFYKYAGVLVLSITSFYPYIIRHYYIGEANRCRIAQHEWLGWLSPKWPGINWMGLFEFFPDTIEEQDTSKHFSTPITGDWDVKDDNMKGKCQVMWWNNIAKNRNRNMVKFVKAKIETITDAIILETNIVMTDYCWGSLSADDAKDNKSSALPPSKFSDECEMFGIAVFKSAVEDLDFSAETEAARKTKRAMSAFSVSVDELMESSTNPHGFKHDDAGRSEARKTVKLGMFGGNFKQVEIANPTDTKVVINTNN
jgi:hypothetical protein